MYRSAIVALKPGNTNEAVSKFAVNLAARQQLKLSGFAVVDPDAIAPAEPVPLGATAFKAHRDATLIEAAHKAAQQTLDAFSQRCKAADVECSQLLCEGQLATETARIALLADLLLVGHTAGTDAGGDFEDASPLHGMLKHCARPCIVVPRYVPEVRNIAVAYDESAQAARALHDFAVSGLWRDATVHVISLAGEVALAEPIAERAASYLKLHHYSAVPHPAVAQVETARHLLEFVDQTAAQLLVMGAYGKPTWREFVFGSVTRSVLRSITVPVFLSH